MEETTQNAAPPRSASVGLARPVAVSVATAAILIGVQGALVLARLDGRFLYSLDDPYIHLSLASQIVHGHYGLSPDAAAAPSSSILYPFLIAALLLGGSGQAAPLIVNVACTLASAAVLAILSVEALPAVARWRVLPCVAAAALLITGLNLVGVAMTGMEHALHVLLVLAWLSGASRFLRRGRPAAWWLACAVLNPLVRYEGATILLATAALLAFRGRPRTAAAVTLAGVTALAGFSLFLHAMGLPYLPSSVLVKSSLTSALAVVPPGGPVLRVLGTFADNVRYRDGNVLLAAMLALALLLARRLRGAEARDRDTAILAVVALAVSAAHLGFGRVDGIARYTTYALALDGAVLLMGFSGEIASAVSGAPGARWKGIAVLGGVLAAFSANIVTSSRTDLASRNIYEQQYQMHRFAADFYRAPVAVNDLGQVSFDNPYPVLDLWGLGSEEARLARFADPSGRWMDDMVGRHAVGLAMIYDPWFAPVPRGWIRLADLHLGSPRVTAAFDVVTFYATGADRVAAIDAALDRWAPTLPGGVRLDRASALQAHL